MVNKFLIIEARFYDDILDSLVEGLLKNLNTAVLNMIVYRFLELEIPAAIAMAAGTSLFLGFVALGCIIEVRHRITIL